MLSITCPICDKRLKIPESMLGRKIACPACHSHFELGGGEEELPMAQIVATPPKPKPKPAPVEDDDDVIVDVVVEKSSRKREFDVIDDDDDDYEPVKKKKPKPKRKVRRVSSTSEPDRYSGRSGSNPVIGIFAIILGGMMLLGSILSVANPVPDRKGNGTIYLGGFLAGPGLLMYGFRRMNGE